MTRRRSAGATVLRFVDPRAENPFWTAKGAAARLEMAFTTAQRALLALERAHILDPTFAARRNPVYCARRIPDTLEEPARLVPR